MSTHRVRAVGVRAIDEGQGHGLFVAVPRRRKRLLVHGLHLRGGGASQVHVCRGDEGAAKKTKNIDSRSTVGMDPLGWVESMRVREGDGRYLVRRLRHCSHRQRRHGGSTRRHGAERNDTGRRRASVRGQRGDERGGLRSAEAAGRCLETPTRKDTSVLNKQGQRRRPGVCVLFWLEMPPLQTKAPWFHRAGSSKG